MNEQDQKKQQYIAMIIDYEIQKNKDDPKVKKLLTNLETAKKDLIKHIEDNYLPEGLKTPIEGVKNYWPAQYFFGRIKEQNEKEQNEDEKPDIYKPDYGK